jgi:hypothetical protein
MLYYTIAVCSFIFKRQEQWHVALIWCIFSSLETTRFGEPGTRLAQLIFFLKNAIPFD